MGWGGGGRCRNAFEKKRGQGGFTRIFLWLGRFGLKFELVRLYPSRR
jgi:hypothetical protein